eukprot:5761283-Prymnesium_polylepis.3
MADAQQQQVASLLHQQQYPGGLAMADAQQQQVASLLHQQQYQVRCEATRMPLTRDPRHVRAVCVVCMFRARAVLGLGDDEILRRLDCRWEPCRRTLPSRSSAGALLSARPATARITSSSRTLRTLWPCEPSARSQRMSTRHRKHAYKPPAPTRGSCAHVQVQAVRRWFFYPRRGYVACEAGSHASSGRAHGRWHGPFAECSTGAPRAGADWNIGSNGGVAGNANTCMYGMSPMCTGSGAVPESSGI